MPWNKGGIKVEINFREIQVYNIYLYLVYDIFILFRKKNRFLAKIWGVGGGGGLKHPHPPYWRRP